VQEVKDLEDLLSHPGWHLFNVLVDSEWGGEAFAGKIARSIGDPAINPTLAVNLLQQATVSREAVMVLMKWPREQVARAKAAAAQRPMASMNRGGL